MIVCHVCGTENADSNKYCEGCGVEVSAPTKADETHIQQAAKSLPDVSVQPVIEFTQIDSVAHTDSQNATSVVGTTQSGEKTIKELFAEGLNLTPLDPYEEFEIPQVPAVTLTQSPEAVANPVLVTPVEEPEAATETKTRIEPEVIPGSLIPVIPILNSDALPAASAVNVNHSAVLVNPRLIPRQFGAVSNATQFPLNGDRLSVGRFDPSTGPVEIDLTGLPGDSHVSRLHGEVFLENAKWMVRDLGSTNGIYIKRAGEDKFSPRLQVPTIMENNDEIAFGNVMFVYREGNDA